MNEYNFQAMLSISFANLCHLFSSLRKGRLHYIRTVGGGVTIFFLLFYNRLEQKETMIRIRIRDLLCLLGLVHFSL